MYGCIYVCPSHFVTAEISNLALSKKDIYAFRLSSIISALSLLNNYNNQLSHGTSCHYEFKIERGIRSDKSVWLVYGEKSDKENMIFFSCVIFSIYRVCQSG